MLKQQVNCTKPWRPAGARVGDLEGAVSQFRTAINLAPTYAPAHFHLAEALRQQGQVEESQQEFQRAAELDPQLKQQNPER